MSPRRQRPDPVLSPHLAARLAALVPADREGDDPAAGGRDSDRAAHPRDRAFGTGRQDIGGSGGGEGFGRERDDDRGDDHREPASAPRHVAAEPRSALSRCAASLRRRLAGVTGALPAFVRAHLLVVGCVVGLGLVLTGYLFFQSRTTSVAVAVTPGVPSPTDAGQAPGRTESPAPTQNGSEGRESGEPSGTAPAEIQVHVFGAVQKPGVVRLPPGSRVADAVAAAGGFTKDAGPAELNLAAVVTDGCQVVVGTRAAPRGEIRPGGAADGADRNPAPGSGTSGTAPAPLDLNTASQTQLEALPGIGPVTAGRIVDWRTRHGRFTSVEQLREVDGIGDKTFARLAPLVRVG